MRSRGTHACTIAEIANPSTSAQHHVPRHQQSIGQPIGDGDENGMHGRHFRRNGAGRRSPRSLPLRRWCRTGTAPATDEGCLGTDA